ncbi:MAG: ATP-binding protein [Polaromonas sp.]|nr:ATP-binding protein [Polaromonas sp.]
MTDAQTSTMARVEVGCEEDVVQARQRARLIAQLLGFDQQDQIRISTAVFEIARNAHQHGQGGLRGEVAFLIEGEPLAPRLTIVVHDHGPGIADLDAVLEGRDTSRTGKGLGLSGSRRLMEHFHIASQQGRGITVTLGQTLPPSAAAVTPAVLLRIAQALAAARSESPMEEIRSQNQELLSALCQLRQRDGEMLAINKELTATNAGMVAVYTDLAQKTDRLQTAEQALRARNEELKGFAYTVSHDLKAPLRGIAGYASELMRKHRAGLGERAQFCLDQILTATHNLDQLIDDLLSYSRIDAETPALTDVNLRGLVEAILQDRRLVIAEQHTEVTLDLPDARLRTWERGLVQVLANLIDNAIKYSRHAIPPRISIRAEPLAHAWRLVVSDNGIGFDMKYHDRLFGLFSRLVRADEFEGTGAGLAIVKKVLEKLGGTVRAESQPGQGASFSVELPS